MVVLYTTNCPRCIVLEKKLKQKGIEFEARTNFDVKEMIKKGFEVDGQVRRSDDPLWKDDREYYWFAHFWKYE